jgi:type IV pilus assembly protein PilB
LDDAEAAPVIKAVNVILAKALSEKVSDIHVEPQEEFMRIRMRKDGVLQEYFRFPKQVVQSITARFKIIANLDIAERRQAQDGRIRRVFEGRTVDFRVNSLPSRYGEKNRAADFGQFQHSVGFGFVDLGSGNSGFGARVC